MDKTNQFRSLEEEITLLQQELKYKDLSVGEILHLLSGKGRALILLLLSLPFCQPLQIPGLSTPFGLIIAFIGLRIAFGKKIWLPRKLLEKKIPSNTLKTITNKTLSLVKKMKRWIYPRLTWLCLSPLMEKANGLIIFLLGLFLALPLPIPLSNLTAAWSIFLVSLGILEDDGLFVLLGWLVCFLTITVFLLMALMIRNLL